MAKKEANKIALPTSANFWLQSVCEYVINLRRVESSEKIKQNVTKIIVAVNDFGRL